MVRPLGDVDGQYVNALSKCPSIKPSYIPITRLSQSPFQFSRFVSTLGKDFSPLQRAKSTGGFFDRGVTGGVSLF